MAATVFAAACFSAAGHAGFLYVPQDEAAPVTVEAAGSEAAEPSSSRRSNGRAVPVPVSGTSVPARCFAA